MNKRETMIADFAAMVRACRSYARPWQISTGVLAAALVLCLFWIAFL